MKVNDIIKKKNYINFLSIFLDVDAEVSILKFCTINWSKSFLFTFSDVYT